MRNCKNVVFTIPVNVITSFQNRYPRFASKFCTEAMIKALKDKSFFDGVVFDDYDGEKFVGKF